MPAIGQNSGHKGLIQRMSFMKAYKKQQVAV
jgi:hypothetical protein